MSQGSHKEQQTIWESIIAMRIFPIREGEQVRLVVWQQGRKRGIDLRVWRREALSSGEDFHATGIGLTLPWAEVSKLRQAFVDIEKLAGKELSHE